MTEDLINRITYHLSSGGLFNPELADHLAVRNLLMECREALAQPEQEPVAYINVEQRKLEWAKYMTWDTPTVVNLPKIPLYTTPPQRTWVGLTLDDIPDDDINNLDFYRGGRWAERILKEKNT